MYVYTGIFSPEGFRVFTGSSDGTSDLWDVNTAQPLSDPIMHPTNVLRSAFTSDAKRLVTMTGSNATKFFGNSGSSSAYVWDIAPPTSAGKKIPNWLRELSNVAAGRTMDDRNAIAPVNGYAMMPSIENAI